MKKTIFHLSLALAATAGLAAAQQTTLTVKITAGPFACTTTAGSGAFLVQNWNFSSTGNETSTPGSSAKPAAISNLTVNRNMDECSVALFKASVMESQGLTVTLTQTEANANGKTTLLTVTLQNAYIANYQVSGATTAPDPVETVSIGFSKITLTYGPGNIIFGWDLQQQKPI